MAHSRECTISWIDPEGHEGCEAKRGHPQHKAFCVPDGCTALSAVDVMWPLSHKPSGTLVEGGTAGPMHTDREEQDQ